MVTGPGCDRAQGVKQGRARSTHHMYRQDKSMDIKTEAICVHAL